MRGFCWSLIFCSLILTGEQSLGQIHRCEMPDGVLAFQETPCDDAVEEDILDIQARPTWQERVASRRDTAELIRREQDRAAFEQRQHDTRKSSQDYDLAVNASEGPVDSSSDFSKTGTGSCPPGQIPLNPSKLDPKRGWSRSRGYVPLRCGVDGGTTSASQNEQLPHAGWDQDPPIRKNRTVNGTVSDPAGLGRIRDRSGNWYSPVPGLPGEFEDQRSGQRCTLRGASLHCD